LDEESNACLHLLDRWLRNARPWPRNIGCPDNYPGPDLRSLTTTSPQGHRNACANMFREPCLLPEKVTSRRGSVGEHDPGLSGAVSLPGDLLFSQITAPGPERRASALQVNTVGGPRRSAAETAQASGNKEPGSWQRTAAARSSTTMVCSVRERQPTADVARRGDAVCRARQGNQR
jgi:hypothetical protein